MSASGFPRPQTLLLSFMADYLWQRPVAVASASVIDVLGHVDVTESAARATLLRMVRNGLLDRYPRGRKMYFGLTERSTALLAEGERHVWAPLDGEWDGSWTLLGFSLTAERQADRHALRSRLTWAGFGPLQNGMFIAPRRVDVTQVLDGLGLSQHVRVFVGAPAPPTEMSDVIAQAWNLDVLADRYRQFTRRWDRKRPITGNALTEKLLLHGEWLQLVRADPHLPMSHLPPSWPGIRAEAVFRRRWAELEPSAAEMASQVLDLIDTTA